MKLSASRLARTASWSVVAVLLAAAAAAQPAGLDGVDAVRRALRHGLEAPEAALAQYELKLERNWLVNFDTPFLRVAQYARSMKIQNVLVSDADVPPKLVTAEVHFYAHARYDAQGPLPNIEYMIVTRQRGDGPAETVMPLSLQAFVRRVPHEDGDGRTRVARSVRAAFPLHVLAPGYAVRLSFEGGTLESVPITEVALTRVR
jgi:hypothetical protein